MAELFYIREGLMVKGNTSLTGSLTVTAGISGSLTGSLQGTASYATQALSASYAPSAGGAAFPFTGSAIITGSLVVSGSVRIASVTSSISTLTLVNSGSVANPAAGALLMFSSSVNNNYLINHNEGAFYVYTRLSGFTDRSLMQIGGLQLHNAASTPSVTSGGAMNITAATLMNIASTTGIRLYNSTAGQLYVGGTTTPTAKIHIVGGTAAASTAPLKFTSGTNLTTPEDGAVEFDGNSLFFTTGSTRSTLLTSINPTSSTNINVQGLTIGKGRTGSLDNVYIHTSSVSPNVTGTRNVGIGGATTGVTSGNYNIGVGFAAGVSATTATHNAFFGGFAGYLSNGSYNTFVGMEANYRAAGNYNVAVGFDCMFENTGTRNTGVGPQAGMYVGTGNDNAYFGYNAGRYIADGATNSGISSASVFLGVDSRPLASSQTNQIVIGYQAIGLGSNTVVIGNNSITTTALKGNTQVSGSLDVSGSTTIRGNTTITGSLLVSGSVRLNGNAGVNITGNTQITGSLLVSGSSLVAGITPIPLAGTIQDGITSVLGSLNDWNINFYQGTVLYSEIAGGTITFGQLCYRTNTGTWALADATGPSAASSTSMLGICVKSSTSTNPTSILVSGFVEVTSYAAILKTGEPLYMSITPGSMSKSAPTASGNVVRIIGNTFWDSNTNAKIILYFNPDRTWIELT